MNILVGRLTFNNIHLKTSDAHKLRGFIGNIFKEHSLIHNHDPETGLSQYRYPLVQFKIIDSIPHIIAVGSEAIEIFSKIFLSLGHINISGKEIPVYEKNFICSEETVGYSDETFVYEFVTPWMALNQKNYRQYLQLETDKQKNERLNKVLIGNILSFSKSMGIWLSKEQTLSVNTKTQQISTLLKGEKMIAFTGSFKANYKIADLIGIGKSVSRGFGAVRRVL